MRRKTGYGSRMRPDAQPAFALAVLFLFMGAFAVMAIEEAPYTEELKDGKFELRDYARQIVAETVVEGSLEEAGNRAFSRLFRYISGNNRSRTNLAMTAPVGQVRSGEKVPMTAPVTQKAEGERWTVSFMMPASCSLETLPEPDDGSVVLKVIPARRMAAIRYRGFWSEKNYRRHLAALESWMKEREIQPMGAPVWARYNPPFTPWFFRRNEILIPIK